MDVERNGRPRVVVTGIGAITPVGTSMKQTWEALTAGQSGIRRISNFDPKSLKVKVAGEIHYDAASQIDPKDARRMSRDSQFAVVAAREAARDAGLAPTDLEKIADRVGVVMGTTLGGWELGLRHLMPFPAARVGPFVLLNSLPNLPGYHIAHEMYGEGPSLTISTACASGTQGIGEGASMIWNNQADVVFAGGVEALMEESLFAGLESMGVLVPGYEDRPEAASRPFDANRGGLVYSEGVSILILETLSRAIARGAHIYCEVLGYGTSTDITSAAIPDPTGKPAIRAMKSALNSARISPDLIEYINPHGPGTRGDAVETLAIKQVFGERAYEVPVSSTKSMIGHCMGAAGAVETAVCAMTIDRGLMHPTINYETPDPECDLDYVPNVAREKKVRVALKNSFGLGGQNASLILGAV